MNDDMWFNRRIRGTENEVATNFFQDPMKKSLLRTVAHAHEDDLV